MSIIAVFLIIIAFTLPVIVLIILFRWLSKKIGLKVTALISAVFVLFIAYEVYEAIYPDDNFYKEEFTNSLKIPFPHSGIIKAKDASYPDMHGKYCSCSLIKTDNNDFKKTLNYIAGQKQFKTYAFDIDAEELQNVLNNSKSLDTSKSIKYYNWTDERNKTSVLFLKTGNEIVLLRCNF